ncbi:MAG TPA: HEAT repeat domain-containing protein [Candidatus Wallbacteria bacterium]|nr:MAG: putative lyase [bacterium ADurb.Bin243]HOD41070.1 HEAT repeat domain-containing protein [Candidatus Wallbacteria bacterium]HPG56842.1 HEAT repeat domain-containing protein [Candidatus Wallbacteria bacterium]
MLSSVEDILKKLKSHDWVERFIAAKTAGEQKIKEAVPVLLELLDDDNVQVRISVVIALKSFSGKKILEHLIRVLADPSEWVRVHAVETIGMYKDRKHIELLSQFLENEESDKVRATLIKVLGELGGAKVLPIITLYLKDSNARVRANAVEAIERISGTTSVDMREHIIPLLDDENNRVKANSVKALFKMGEAKAIEVLKNMIKSKDDWMRASAAYVFGVIDYEDSVKHLIDILNDNCWFVIKNAIKSLVRKGDKIIPLLEKKLKDPQVSSTIKMNIVSVLGELATSECLKLLIPLLNDESGDLRQHAESVIDKIQEKKDNLL